MSKMQQILARVDEERLTDLDELCADLVHSREKLVATAVLRFVKDEIGAITSDEFAHLPPDRDPSPTGQAQGEAESKFRLTMSAFLKVVEDAIEPGEVFSREEMERWFADRVASRSQAAASA